MHTINNHELQLANMSKMIYLCMNIQFLRDEVLDCIRRVACPIQVRDILASHHGLFRHRRRNLRPCRRAIISRQNLTHLFIFRILIRLCIPRKDVSQFAIAVVL